MRITIEREKSKEKLCEDIPLEKKIEYATQTLERNIGFINTCDSKTSIVLTAFGVCVTIIFTSEGIHTILNIIYKALEFPSFCNVAFLLCLALSCIILLIGITNLISVLLGRVNLKTKNKNISTDKTPIFFSGIVENSSFLSYKKKFINMNDEKYLDYLITEIYINSQIASIKYSKYNWGVKLTCIGFGLFLLFSIIGVHVY